MNSGWVDLSKPWDESEWFQKCEDRNMKKICNYHEIWNLCLLCMWNCVVFLGTRWNHLKRWTKSYLLPKTFTHISNNLYKTNIIFVQHKKEEKKKEKSIKNIMALYKVRSKFMFRIFKSFYLTPWDAILICLYSISVHLTLR